MDGRVYQVLDLLESSQLINYRRRLYLLIDGGNNGAALNVANEVLDFLNRNIAILNDNDNKDD